MSFYTSSLGSMPEVPTGNGVTSFFKSPFVSDPNIAKKKAFIDTTNDDSYTFKELKDLTGRAAYLFRSQYGINNGDVVALFGTNHIFTPVIHFGTISLGAVVSPGNVMYSPEELAHQLKVVEPKLLIVLDPLKPVAEEALRIAGVSAKIETYSTLFATFWKLLRDSQAPQVQPVDVDAATHPAYYCFSSGTSGLAKGVITTHHNIVANTLQVMAADTEFALAEISQGCVLPMSHIFALNTAIWSGPYAGKTTSVFPKFDLEDLVAKIVKHKIQLIQLVPPIILLLGKTNILDKYPEFNDTMKYIMSGAAPLSPEIMDLVSSKCPDVKIAQGYGLTETTPITHIGLVRDYSKYTKGSIGWLVPGVEARLVDADSGKDVEGYNKPGELWLRGPMVMAGYLKNTKATEESITKDGWFKTGDVAIVDETEQFYIVDRIKELIKSNGHQVAPAELEALLLRNEMVEDAAVIGVYNDDKSSEMPRAYVVLRRGSKPKDILTWFNKKVAKHKRLWGGLVVAAAIPKSASGKILRKELRNRKNDTVIRLETASL